MPDRNDLDTDYNDFDIEYGFEMNRHQREFEGRTIHTLNALDFLETRRSRASAALDAMDDFDVRDAYYELDSYEENLRRWEEWADWDDWSILEKAHLFDPEDQFEAMQERLMGHRRLPKAFRNLC